MAKQLVIYVPQSGCNAAEYAELKRRYPNARFVTRWEDGAVMWQDAIKPTT